MKRHGIRELPRGERSALAQDIRPRRPGKVEPDSGSEKPADFLQKNSPCLGGAFMRERDNVVGPLDEYGVAELLEFVGNERCKGRGARSRLPDAGKREADCRMNVPAAALPGAVVLPVTGFLLVRKNGAEKREFSLVEIFPGVLENRFCRSKAQGRWRQWIGGLHISGHPGVLKDGRSFSSIQVNSWSPLKPG